MLIQIMSTETSTSMGRLLEVMKEKQVFLNKIETQLKVDL